VRAGKLKGAIEYGGEYFNRALEFCSKLELTLKEKFRGISAHAGPAPPPHAKAYCSKKKA
jgi:hypothetical protein